MNRSIGLLFALAAIVTNVGAMSIKMHAQSTDVPATANSSWKTHTAFDGQISKIIEGDRYVYVFAHQAFYHKDSSNLFGTPRGTVLYIDKQNLAKGVRGLFDVYPASGADVRILDYNPRTKNLWICYDDGGIDVFEEESTSMYSIKHMKMPTMSSFGSMGTISFDLENDTWIAMDRGYVRIDGEKFEVKERGYFGIAVESICRVGERVVAIMDNAIYETSENTDRSSLTAFHKHDELNCTSINRIMPISSESFATLIDGSKLSLASWNNGNIVMETKVNDASISNQLCTNTGSIWDGNSPCIRHAVANQYENNFMPIQDGYFVFGTKSAYYIPMDSAAHAGMISYELPVTSPRYIGTEDFNDFWFYEKRQGFYSRSVDNNNSWSAIDDKIQWKGPVGMELTVMDYSPEVGVMVMNQNSTPIHYNLTYGQSPMLLSGYKSGVWTNYSPIYGTPESLTGNQSLTNLFKNERSYPYPLRHPSGFVVDPLHPEYVIVSSLDGGIIAMNTHNVEGQIMRFTDSKDGYKAFPGYMENFPLSSGGNRDSLSEIIGVDDNNVIWASNLDIFHWVEDKGGVMLMYWTPNSRNQAMEKQDVSVAENWKRLFFRIDDLKDPLSVRCGNGAALKHPKNKNKIAVISNQTNRKGIVVCDHNGTLEDTSDDKGIIIYKVKIPEGLMQYEGWIMDVAEDPLTGNLWMSFDSKLVSIDLSKPVKDGVAEGESLYVTNMDGSRESTVMSDMVHCIAFDEYNRMWVGTGWSGVYGISTDRKKVFAHYDISNSPLKSNQIDGLCWDPESHELMIGSDMGLLSVKPDKAGSTVQGIINPMAYPVNVLPEYKGTVKFVNLPVQTVLTVCDGTGRHIKQLPAVDNGQTIWDVCDADGQPVSQGVYTVRDVARQVSDFRIIVTR